MPRTGDRLISVCLLIGLFVLSACQGGEPAQEPAPMQSSRSEPNPFGGERVSFPAADGASIVGAVFGEGEVALALAHMGRQGDDATDWTATAEALSGSGVRVLIFNRRGVCTPVAGSDSVCSEGDGGLPESWQDVVGAVDYLRSTGARTVVVGGASLGAMASLSAATRDLAGIDALVWFAGILNGVYSFTEQSVQSVDIPAFVASTTGDTVGAAGDAQTLAGWLAGPTDLVLLPGTYHGTDIFTLEDPTTGDQFRSELVEFLSTIG